ncbi:hypothetical protein [Scandinavium goeteborgense]|uniref:Uncharacterized protein n=1 Tax=Scandinavium goeteborgense TaxID=1851514 RepID=A0A4R6EHI6_SCAGO|nr:hypothetical protein [Scandinavium goeteborgense]TDN57304.1 hypothetical protein EC847_10998 [Scandinavium goeteborgense]
MAINPTLDGMLFTVPFTSTTDFTELADNCERFVEVIVECDDPAQKMALCGRLSACLDLLQPALLEPIPTYLVASLTVEEIPADLPTLEMEADQLGDYCQALTQLLLSGSLATKTERTIRDLLYQLVFYFAGTLKAPRWLKTEDGIVSLEGAY